MVALSLVLFGFMCYGFSQEKLKVYVSVDMGGFAGVVHPDQVSTSGMDCSLARKWPTWPNTSPRWKK